MWTQQALLNKNHCHKDQRYDTKKSNPRIKSTQKLSHHPSQEIVSHPNYPKCVNSQPHDEHPHCWVIGDSLPWMCYGIKDYKDQEVYSLIGSTQNNEEQA